MDRRRLYGLVWTGGACEALQRWQQWRWCVIALQRGTSEAPWWRYISGDGSDVTLAPSPAPPSEDEKAKILKRAERFNLETADTVRACERDGPAACTTLS